MVTAEAMGYDDLTHVFLDFKYSIDGDWRYVAGKMTSVAALVRLVGKWKQLALPYALSYAYVMLKTLDPGVDATLRLNPPSRSFGS